MPGGSAVGIAHHDAGIGVPRVVTLGVRGSPAATFVVVRAASRTGSFKLPAGTSRHSMRSSVTSVPETIPAAANGYGTVRRSETSQAMAATTTATAAIQRTTGGRVRSNTDQRIALDSRMEGLRRRRPVDALHEKGKGGYAQGTPGATVVVTSQPSSCPPWESEFREVRPRLWLLHSLPCKSSWQ